MGPRYPDPDPDLLPAAAYTRTSCSWTAPQDPELVYWVREGRVTDTAGHEVPGVSAWDDGGAAASVCGLEIASMAAEHAEDAADVHSAGWACQLQFAEGAAIHQQPGLAQLGAGLHLKDSHHVARPLLDTSGLAPLHYSVSIVPDLATNNQTISFTGAAEVETGRYILSFSSDLGCRLSWRLHTAQYSTFLSTSSPSTSGT